MKEIDLALADISNIRAHLASSTCFLGIAPEYHIFTGIFVFCAALLQDRFFNLDSIAYVWVWTGVMTVIGVIGAQKAVVRARKIHGVMARELIFGLVQKGMPFLVAGTVITFVICAYAVENVWMLPGIWQLFVALLAFSILSNLPRGLIVATVWYFIAGVCVLWIGAKTQALSPWMMGIPLTIGQILVGIMLNLSNRSCERSE